MHSSTLVKEAPGSQVVYPSVTIAIPALNEAKHIERVVRNFLNSSYSNVVEVIIADGGSTDGTQDIIERLSQEDRRVQLIHNPYRFQSAALNMMIHRAKGELFLRADAHCEYSEDYVENSIMEFLRTGAKNVGGAQRYIASNSVQAGIALAVKSFLGNGGAKYRDPNFQGFADTVFLGCYRTNDLKRIQGFSLENVVNEDSELNLRLQDLSSRSIYVSKHIKSWYYPRSTFKSLFKQYFNYGRGRFITFKKHRQKVPNRSIAPFIFGLLFLVYILFDIIHLNLTIWPAIIFASLLGLSLLECIKITYQTKDEFSNRIWQSRKEKVGYISRVWNCFVAIQIMLIGHFFGFSWQLIRHFKNWLKESFRKLF